jgi:hypothetical protein
MWAEAYDCAIVLIGHMNKREGSKDLYRGLGSIDIVAAARSVLQVERDPDDPDVRIVTQIKNSLESIGGSFRFEIRPHTGFRWISTSGNPVPPKVKEDLNWTDQLKDFKTKQEEAAFILTRLLKERDVASKEIFLILSERGIAEKTARHVKEEMGIKAYRKNRRWFWTLRKDIKEENDSMGEPRDEQ